MSFKVKGHLVRHIKMGLHAQQENYPDVKEDPTVKGIGIKGISGIPKKLVNMGLFSGIPKKLVNMGLFTKCVTLKKGK